MSNNRRAFAFSLILVTVIVVTLAAIFFFSRKAPAGPETSHLLNGHENTIWSAAISADDQHGPISRAAKITAACRHDRWPENDLMDLPSMD